MAAQTQTPADTSCRIQSLVRVFAIGLTLSLPLARVTSADGQGNSEFRPPQQVDGSRAPGGQPNSAASQGTASQDANTDASRQAFGKLVIELDNLIPGSIQEDPEQKKVVEEAVTAFQLRDANRVIEILEIQNAKDPDFPPTDLLLAGLTFATNDTQSGRVLLERAGIKYPNSPAVYSAFARLAINEGRTVDGLALLEKMTRTLVDTKLSEKAKAFYNMQLLDGMSDVAMRQLRFDDARKYLSELRRLFPQNSKALMVSAELEFKEKNIDKAVEFLKQLRARIPQTRSPETIIGSWYQRINEPAEAKTWILKAASNYPKNPQVQLEVAAWAVNEELFPTASAAIKQAEINGETPLSKSLKAKIAFANGSYAIAESHYEALSKMQPDNIDSANMYALSLIESNEPNKKKLALEIANRNFRALPNNVVSQATLGYINLRMGDVEQAKAALGRALQTNNASPEIRYFGATVLKAINQPENARTVLQSALDHKGLFLYRTPAQKLMSELPSAPLGLTPNK
ncbi:MAG: putative Zn-dependent protease [Mariniblastus sp.]|jgi:predicted Zn-dependent protease